VKSIVTFFVLMGIVLGMLFPSMESIARIFKDSEKYTYANPDLNDLENNSDENDLEGEEENESKGEEEERESKGEEESEEEKRDSKELKEYITSEDFAVNFLNNSPSFTTYYKCGFSDHYLEIISPPPQL